MTLLIVDLGEGRRCAEDVNRMIRVRRPYAVIVIQRIYGFSAIRGHESLVNSVVDRVADELDVAVAERDINAAGMFARRPSEVRKKGRERTRVRFISVDALLIG